jgi:4-hydroxy-tetrahydrodipicolinate synthase
MRRTPAVVGVCPVLETPFHPDGRVDLDGFASVVDHAVDAGANGLMFPGFASEFLKLTDDERDSLVHLMLQRAARAPGVASVIAVTDHSTEVAVRRARHAAKSGASAINLLPPHLLAPSRDAVREHVHDVAAAVFPLPVIVQHAPNQTGSTLNGDDLEELAKGAVNVVQVKVEATPPGKTINALLNGEPALGSLVGYAGLHAMDALCRGADGVMPGCSFVELYVELWSLWSAKLTSPARALHVRMVPYLSYWMQSSELIVAVEKEISYRRGIIGSAFCRRPSYQLDHGEQAMIDRFLDEFGDHLPMVRRRD